MICPKRFIFNYLEKYNTRKINLFLTYSNFVKILTNVRHPVQQEQQQQLKQQQQQQQQSHS